MVLPKNKERFNRLLRLRGGVMIVVEVLTGFGGGVISFVCG